MSEPPLLPAMVCQRCGATNPPHATKCWLCERNESANPYASPTLVAATAASPAPTLAQSRVQQLFLALLIGCAVVAIMVGVGLSVQDVGLLVPYLIVIAPAFLATGVRAALMIGRREQPRPSTLFLTFLWSGVFTAMVLVLLVVASVIALFVWCIHMIAGGG